MSVYQRHPGSVTCQILLSTNFLYHLTTHLSLFLVRLLKSTPILYTFRLSAANGNAYCFSSICAIASSAEPSGAAQKIILSVCYQPVKDLSLVDIVIAVPTQLFKILYSYRIFLLHTICHVYAFLYFWFLSFDLSGMSIFSITPIPATYEAII